MAIPAKTRKAPLHPCATEIRAILSPERTPPGYLTHPMTLGQGGNCESNRAAVTIQQLPPDTMVHLSARCYAEWVDKLA